MARARGIRADRQRARPSGALRIRRKAGCEPHSIDNGRTPHGLQLHPLLVRVPAEDLEWNGHSTVQVAGRDNWTWYYGKDTGLSLGGQFVISTGGFRVKLTRSDGFGSPVSAHGR